MSTIRVKTSSPAGDLISFMPGLRQLSIDTKAKITIYQRLNMVGAAYIGARHPFGNSSGTPICFPKEMFTMMRPLLVAQEYIHDFIIFDGQEVDFDMDDIRQKTFTNQPHGEIRKWPSYAFPQMATDLSQQCIFLKDHKEKTGKVIINFTQRHRNPPTHYFFLKKHQDKIVFAGLQEERDEFCDEFGLDIPLLIVKDFYDLAQELEAAKFFMGNQSFCFQLAENMKIPRLLEIFANAPNVIPIGKDAYDFYSQSAAEYQFEKLLNR